ncbi:hypothetical protein NDU88_007392 [Pleurodeles waltl]|uniref:Uncharacterized protein n=1 Tax=Pleurodeles waltl TaxID=8319 RepID=A0AAV7RPC9_PLEWA|nr:hypothetical protein NDU88_007392 [Pleurodeles waltl]
MGWRLAGGVRGVALGWRCAGGVRGVALGWRCAWGGAWLAVCVGCFLDWRGIVRTPRYTQKKEKERKKIERTLDDGVTTISMLKAPARAQIKAWCYQSDLDYVANISSCMKSHS